MGGPDRFLEAVLSNARPQIAAPVLVVVAHPDDETLGCGALLPRLVDVTILHVTDGAPRDGRDAARQGFATAADYASARRAELGCAAKLAGVAPERLASLGIADQGAAFAIAAIARELTPRLAGSAAVLTHAYESGHPDHDATALAVWAAVASLGQSAPRIYAMPFYRAHPSGSGVLRQSFGPDEAAATLRLTAAERERKAAMLACFESQSETLRPFGAADEPYRPFSFPGLESAPGGPGALYDEYGWTMTSTKFKRLARAALADLGLRA